MIEVLKSRAEDICTFLRQGYHSRANYRLADLSDMWVKATEDIAQQEGGAETVITMQVVMDDFRKAQNRSDYLRMADLIQYQIVPAIEQASQNEKRPQDD